MRSGMLKFVNGHRPSFGSAPTAARYYPYLPSARDRHGSEPRPSTRSFCDLDPLPPRQIAPVCPQKDFLRLWAYRRILTRSPCTDRARMSLRDPVKFPGDGKPAANASEKKNTDLTSAGSQVEFLSSFLRVATPIVRYLLKEGRRRYAEPPLQASLEK